MELSRSKLALLCLTGLIVLLWLFATPISSLSGGFWPLRRSLVMVTGMLAIGMMSAAVVLAARPVQIESWLGGLDKYYRLHKWLGIGALVFSIAHWLIEIVPPDLVQRGLLVRPPRRPGGGGEEGLLDALRPVAAELGEIALYLFILLMIVALWRRIPYHWFHLTHRLLAPVYLVLVFHSVVMLGNYWPTAVGVLLAVLMLAGSVAAAVSLFRRIGHSRRASGTVETVRVFDDRSTLEVGVRLETMWPGHKAGQFAFLDFEDSEGAHPFTMSSAWKEDGQIQFTIKGIGDYTRKLPDLVHVGQRVTVEGPYGRFEFDGEEAQIWIGGGVGVTPFMARMEGLAATPSAGPVDMFYSTTRIDPLFVRRVRDLAANAGVQFHLIHSPPEPLLTIDLIEQLVPDWQEREIWFCGPSGFLEAIRSAALKRGFPPSRFHTELFEMR